MRANKKVMHFTRLSQDSYVRGQICPDGFVHMNAEPRCQDLWHALILLKEYLEDPQAQAAVL